MASVRLDDDTGEYRITSANLAAVDAYEPGSVAKVITVVGALNEGTVTPDDLVRRAVAASSSTTPTSPMPSRTRPSRCRSPASSPSPPTSGRSSSPRPSGSPSRRSTCGRSGFGVGQRPRLPGRVQGHPPPAREVAGHREGHGRLRPGRRGDRPPADRGDQHHRQRRDLRRAEAGEGDDRRRRRAPRHRALGDPRGRDAARSPQTMNALMRDVVCAGTASQAKIPGYTIAGKTGTGYKAQANGTYFKEDGTKAYYASFVGFLPAEDPQVTILVSIDEPPARRQPLRWQHRGAGLRPHRRGGRPRTRHQAADRRRRLSDEVSDRWRARLPGAVCSATSAHRIAGARRRSGDLGLPASRSTPGSSRPESLFCCVRGEHADGHRLRRSGGRGRRRRAARRPPAAASTCPSCIVGDVRRRRRAAGGRVPRPSERRL